MQLSMNFTIRLQLLRRSGDMDEKLWKKPGGFRIELPSEHMLKLLDQLIREHEENHKPVSPEMNMAYQRIVRRLSEMPSDDSDFDDQSSGAPRRAPLQREGRNEIVLDPVDLPEVQLGDKKIGPRKVVFTYKRK